jgi:hypothetical protein
MIDEEMLYDEIDKDMEVVPEVWNVLYLDNNDCIYLIGNHAVQEAKHVIYDDVTEELMNAYLDENGKPNYKAVEGKPVKLTAEEKETLFPKSAPTQLDRIEESIQEIKNMREQEIVDRYTLTLINEGIIS